MKRTKLGQQGFTMIELIMVIVILAILSVVAIPKFIDMRTEAAKSAADGVFAATQSAAVINHASVMMGKAAATLPAYEATDCANGLIAGANAGTCLMKALEGTPEGWAASAKTITKDTYVITVTTDQTANAKAVLSKSW
ncbi:MAG: hypothetical protein A2520_03960 [Deltaproteobacteria bacterium RIFOXYD12_FULL_53_23]|nr:MAG: hypothetical protein A2520_03960 [Deltaproteobacteria bacterium RIFOXYD12_FULL_53_23]